MSVYLLALSLTSFHLQASPAEGAVKLDAAPGKHHLLCVHPSGSLNKHQFVELYCMFVSEK